MELVIEKLRKSYGDNLVLDDIDFRFEEGKIYGLLGRNGSGKTTLFNCLDELIPYDSGRAYLLENGREEPLSDANTGLVLTECQIPDFLTGYEFIRSFMEIMDIDEKDKIDDYFRMISLSKEDQHKLIKDYSMGMKNKIQILMYLISKPKVLLLDEPLTSFDVIVAAEIKEILKEQKQGRIIVFSSHILELVQSLCDEIVVINNRKLILLDSEKIHSEDFEETVVEILKNENRKDLAAEEN
ncbi:MAG: ATP-binding cassette domain-containing protein [Erysipelotrichaceae bacterium]|nr:ATP-binding cassette domain-containing protein [Erysipelotrichaceae bacterium]